MIKHKTGTNNVSTLGYALKKDKEYNHKAKKFCIRYTMSGTSL